MGVRRERSDGRRGVDFRPNCSSGEKAGDIGFYPPGFLATVFEISGIMVSRTATLGFSETEGPAVAEATDAIFEKSAYSHAVFSRWQRRVCGNYGAPDFRSMYSQPTPLWRRQLRRGFRNTEVPELAGATGAIFGRTAVAQDALVGNYGCD